jgi:16S rRNA (guanine966-N2)-methyltransferase
MRPSSSLVRSAALDIIGPGWLGGRTVWDLCCGSGAFGMECLSSGAGRCVFVDRDRAACSFVSSALAELGGSGLATVVCSDLTGLDTAGLERPHAVFLDPPYSAKSLYSWAEGTDWRAVIHPGGVLMIESASAEPVLEGMRTRKYGGTFLHWRWFEE